MSGIYVVVSTLIAVIAMGTTSIAHAENVDQNLRADLELIAHRRILFAHQSVGMNLLDGVQQLSRTAGVPINVVEVTTASSIQTAMIGHTFVAENGDPISKINNFERVMGLHRTEINVALMKFCFVDFNSETDVKKLFARYLATINSLRTRNPGTTFVHVTAPLTTIQGDLKTRLKLLFGYAPYGTIENIRREEYNTLLRQAYQGREPIFDLARIESTDPNGASVTYEWKGSVVPVMDSAYTNDGGHLNTVGKLRAARELISVLASIPDRTATSETLR
jgi:hypothetical protein